MGDPIIFFAGIFTTLLFFIGYGLTIKEFKELRDERETNTFPEESNAEIKK
jgi:hypothetical protein